MVESRANGQFQKDALFRVQDNVSELERKYRTTLLYCMIFEIYDFTSSNTTLHVQDDTTIPFYGR